MAEPVNHTQIAIGEYIAQAINGRSEVNAYEVLSKPVTTEVEIDAGVLHLSQLPTETIPAIAALPHLSRVPHPPVSTFVGRTKELQQIARTFAYPRKGGNRSLPTVAVVGESDLGKTALVAEFAHRYGHYFTGGVFWIGCSERDVRLEIAACGGEGGLRLRADFAIRPLAEQVEMVRAAWQSPLPRLLVFDGCEDPRLFGEYRPLSGGTCTLLTSRYLNWNPIFGVETLVLPTLSRQESILLLQQYTGTDDPSFDAIAEKARDLPGALARLGPYLHYYHHDMTPYEIATRLSDLWDVH